MNTVRTGGDLAVETLTALGARTVFGIPGQHALGLFDALRRTPELRLVANRVENNAAFAADGHARRTGAVTPLLVSTGPGALLTLASLQEARESSVPVLAISSQVPAAGLGGARRGYLHELPDQQASFRGVVKSTHEARHPSQIPSAIAAAWRSAASAPAGPVWVEIPQDVLTGPAGAPPVTGVDGSPVPLPPRPELVEEAARLLDGARRPVVLAGGGVVRSGGADALLELAERLRAPVACTFGGKDAFPWEHQLSLQSWLEDRHLTDYLEQADVLLVAGSGLGELSSNYHTFRPRGRIIQVEADLGRIEANHPALGVHADAAATLRALAGRVRPRAADRAVEDEVSAVRAKVAARLAAQDLGAEQGILASMRAALPDGAPSFWDMTVLAYWAWSAWDPRGGTMHTAQGAGGLGFAFPAALGAAAVGGGPVLAVSGDGGAMYGIAELAAARQHGLDVTWLIVDDGGYGILREYMADAYGAAAHTELARPDFAALAASFGVAAVRTAPDRLADDLAGSLAEPGPSVVLLPAVPRMFAPTHLG
ncbi:acetolactate synthase-1/2/3 large subunit [Murinocardiopsis flavida]|uniref:Acetolactate synthase-1/2/3 large subunit n=1 Tax=Murinocardiopsis flavida TaxID=645275 RepID=A0A2P8D9C7_9ACTN|nr:thiamine pyrophosphate-binding protein [Murinocardiopsis flavida]PSK93797.1 acetolactate synthase-1/2/3 large subunit [Murinocardiopsis flavida]